MLADFNLPPDQIKQTANHVNRAARRMGSLLDEVGQVAQAKPGQREECRVEDLVSSAVESLEATAAGQRVAIRRFMEPELRVLCEPHQVERVLVNLIANSLDVMPDGGDVSIRDGSDAGMVWIEIKDSGPGIPQEIRAKLFQPFATAGKPNGLGLGLALARQTMLDHGGDLELMPSATGARFRLRFPLASCDSRIS